MKIKYAILVGDGMADLPVAELGGKTPLEYAKTPNMDALARKGIIGRVRTIPEGFDPGSDIANMSLLGYDPALYFTGRAPIEAASMGIALGPQDIAFRCNLVHLSNSVMQDYCAGHIETADAVRIITELQNALNSDTVHFHPGVSYRHLVVIKNLLEAATLRCTPPHDISGKPYAEYLPRGQGQEFVAGLCEKAHAVLAHSATNNDLAARGKTTVTDIWLWGQGRPVEFPSLKSRYGLEGAVISAVDLVRGLGKLAGLSIVKVLGATGYLGTNYRGKVDAARECLAKEDFVYLHVEAPDETSHEGIAAKKIQAIEEFDRHVVGEMVKFRKHIPGLRIMVAPDHATLLSTKTHDAMPVPFAVCGEGIVPDGNSAGYCEQEALARSTKIHTGPSLFDAFIKGEFGKK